MVDTTPPASERIRIAVVMEEVEEEVAVDEVPRTAVFLRRLREVETEVAVDGVLHMAVLLRRLMEEEEGVAVDEVLFVAVVPERLGEAEVGGGVGLVSGEVNLEGKPLTAVVLRPMGMDTGEAILTFLRPSTPARETETGIGKGRRRHK